jgi:hypothetical protein
MADRLSPIPGSEPKPLSDVLASSTTRKASVPDAVKRDVAKRKAKEPPADKFTKDSDNLITIEEYHKLMEDRPVKFGPKTSGFVRGGGSNGSPCLHCVHWYTSPASAHTTCEIVRVSDSDDQVKADDFCKLFTQDGKTLPFLKEEETAEKATA